MTKRLFAVLLAMMMLLSVLPVVAGATEAASGSDLFSLQLAPQGHTSTNGTTQLNLYLSASRAAQVGSFQFTLELADNIAVADYTGTGIWGNNNIVAYVAENTASTIAAGNGSTLLATFQVTGEYVPGTSVVLKDVEVNEWNTGATKPTGASVSYAASAHDENVTWTAWSEAKLPSTSGYYYLTKNISGGFVTLSDANVDITLCLNGYDLAISGRGYTLKNGAKVTICDCTAHTDENGDLVAGTIKPGTADGGLFYNTASSVTLENVIVDGKGITNNSNTSVIYSKDAGASVTLDNVVIRNCTSKKQALYIVDSALNITDSVIKNCTGTMGAIYLYGAEATLTDVTMTGNTTTEAGASAVAIFGESHCTIDGGSYTGNISTKATSSSGAVYIGNAPCALTLKGAAVVDDNTCTAGDGTPVERNITIQGNEDLSKNAQITADGLTNGSNVDVYSVSTYTQPSFLVLTENQTSWDPSWMSCNGYQVIRKDGSFVLSHGHAGDAEGTVWNALSTGGKLPSTSGHYYLTKNLSVGFVELDKTAANGTKVVICLNGYNMTIGGRAYSLYNGANVTFCDCTAHTDANGNKVAGTIKPGTSSGGVVFNSGSTLTVKDIIVDGSGIANTNDAGAFFMNGASGSTTLENVLLRNCSGGNGSAVGVRAGTLTMRNCVLENNTASGDAGGAVYINGPDTNNTTSATITGCTFTGNTSAKASSAIYIIRATASITDCVITDNLTKNTSKYTGALYICGTPDVTISGKTIINNNFVDAGSRECNVLLQNNNSSNITVPKLTFKDLSTSAKIGLTTYTQLSALSTNLSVSSGTVVPGVLTYENDGHCYYYDTESKQFISQGHVHDHIAVVTEPTCTEDGYTTYTCNCGDSYVADPVKTPGHIYNAVVTPPTCTEDGYTTYTCSCGDSYVADTVTSSGHSYEATVTEPTCTEDGYTTYTCITCGHSYTDNVVASTGHSYNAVVTEPSCTTDGYTTFTCTVCGHSYTGNEVTANGHSFEKGSCTVCGEADPDYVPEIQKFNLKGSSMTLGNTLEINFAVENANISEGDYIVVSKEYADGSVVSKTYSQSEWTAQGSKIRYVSFSVTAKEMNDQLTVIVYNENGQQISETYTDSVAGYCQRKLNEEEKRAAGPRAKYLTLYVDMLNYGAAAQQKWTYNVDDLANAELTEAQKGYATVIGEKENILQKGEGYRGTSLSLKDNILMNVAFNTSFLTDVKYAEVNFVSHNGTDKSVTVAIEDFIAQGSTTKYISIDVMAVADYAQPVTVKLYNTAGECVSTTIDSMGSYAGRQTKDVYLYEAILAFGMGAYNYFHS